MSLFLNSLNKEVLNFHANSVQVLVCIITCIEVREKTAMQGLFCDKCVSQGKKFLPNHSIPPLNRLLNLSVLSYVFNFLSVATLFLVARRIV